MRGKAQGQFRILYATFAAVAPERMSLVRSERATRRKRGVPVHLAR